MTKEQERISKRRAYMKAHNQRPEVKAHMKASYLLIPNCKGNSTRVYTNGVTEEMKKRLPELMNKAALKLLREK